MLGLFDTRRLLSEETMIHDQLGRPLPLSTGKPIAQLF